MTEEVTAKATGAADGLAAKMAETQVSDAPPAKDVSKAEAEGDEEEDDEDDEEAADGPSEADKKKKKKKQA